MNNDRAIGDTAILMLRLLLVGVVLLLWETLPRLGFVATDLVPPFSDVAQTLWGLLGRAQFRIDLATTALEIIAAFAISAPLGALLGLAIAESPYLSRIFDPLLFFLFGIPKSIFLPLFILSLGIGFSQKVAFGCFSTTLLVLLSTQAAVRSVRPDHLLTARSYGATRWQIVTRVYLPSMLPILLEALRLAMIFTFTAVTLAEMYASRTGIGHNIESWGENFMMRPLLAGVLLLSLTAILVNGSIRWVERRCGAWRIWTTAPRSAAGRVAATADGAGSIWVDRVSHTYPAREGPVPALVDISFTAASGRFVVLVGPSGCGKSSLLMMLAGLRRADEGAIHCAGRPMTAPDPLRVGVVFQEANLFPWLSALDNVAFPLALRRVKSAERRRRAHDMLRLVGLDGFGARHPHELSGGMRQRVAIARGLVQDPPVLLMDEPFGALDEQTRMTMGDELLRIWSQTGKTVVFVTHSLSEAIYLADEVLVMSARPGRIVDRIAVELPRPRTYEMMSDAEFNRLRDRILHHIRSGHAP